MTAPGLTDIAAREDVLGAIGVLTAAPTPRGAEFDTALRLADWAGSRWPSLIFSVDAVGPSGGNVVCSSGPVSGDDLLIYSHLDTSLTGLGEHDRSVTGSEVDARLGFSVVGDTVSAFGLGVARGPAAAALVGFVRAAQSAPTETGRSLRLILAGGGTHENSLTQRAGTSVRYSGLESYLSTYPRPAAAVVAKAGPPGILWDEPGAGYLRVRVSSSRAAVLMRDRADPPGGLPARIGDVCGVVEAWRERLRTDVVPIGQSAREVGIGAVRAGSTRKPDLLPAYVELYVYVVMLPGDHLEELGADLERSAVAAFGDGPLKSCSVTVDVSIPEEAAVTSPDAPLVRSASGAWQRVHGEAPPVISGWTGSTDGALLRARGVDTIRTGPASVTSNEPEWDAFRLDDLVRFANVYHDIGVDWTRGERR